MTPSVVALDTSVAVPLLVGSHPDHPRVSKHLRDLDLRLTTHSLAETYSVLTRLPGDARREPLAAAALIDSVFGEVASVSSAASKTIHHRLSDTGIAGGATYDAMVAIAAAENELTLVTRDFRAAATYAAMGARVELVRN